MLRLSEPATKPIGPPFGRLVSNCYDLSTPDPPWLVNLPAKGLMVDEGRAWDHWHRFRRTPTIDCYMSKKADKAPSFEESLDQLEQVQQDLPGGD